METSCKFLSGKRLISSSLLLLHFPTKTGQVGFAYIGPIHEPLQQQQSGEVFFKRVEEDMPVEGEFDFRTENGKRFIGKFNAEWGNGTAMCG